MSIWGRFEFEGLSILDGCEADVFEFEGGAFGLEADVAGHFVDLPCVVDEYAVNVDVDIPAIGDDFVFVPLSDGVFGHFEFSGVSAVGSVGICFHTEVVDVPEIACASVLELAFDGFGPDFILADSADENS